MLADAGVRIFHGGNGVTVREALARLGRTGLDPMDAPDRRGPLGAAGTSARSCRRSGERRRPRSEDRCRGTERDRAAIGCTASPPVTSPGRVAAGTRARSGASGDAHAGRAAQTTARALIAAGSYIAQDVRDPDGLVRPVLRGAALRMAVSRQRALRRLGSSYLRGDPPTPQGALPQDRPQGCCPRPSRPRASTRRLRQEACAARSTSARQRLAGRFDDRDRPGYAEHMPRIKEDSHAPSAD